MDQRADIIRKQGRGTVDSVKASAGIRKDLKALETLKVELLWEHEQATRRAAVYASSSAAGSTVTQNIAKRDEILRIVQGHIDDLRWQERNHGTPPGIFVAASRPLSPQELAELDGGTNGLEQTFLDVPKDNSSAGKVLTELSAGRRIAVYESHKFVNHIAADFTSATMATTEDVVSLRCDHGWIDERNAKEKKPQTREIKLKGSGWTLIAASADERPQWERQVAADTWVAYPMHTNADLEKNHHAEQKEWRFTCDWALHNVLADTNARLESSQPEPEPEPEPEPQPEPEPEPELPTKKKAKAKKGKKSLSDDADPCAYEIDFSVDRSRWVEVHVCTGEERAVRRSMVPCTDNILLAERSGSGQMHGQFPDYWGKVEIAEGSGGLALEDLRGNDQLLRILNACL